MICLRDRDQAHFLKCLMYEKDNTTKFKDTPDFGGHFNHPPIDGTDLVWGAT